MNREAKYVVSYRLKKDEKFIQERLRFNLEDAKKLVQELKSIDYIEYLSTRIERLDIYS